MAGERTTDGYLVRLKPHGVGRWFTVAFLTVWLCGWAAGEAFALWFLGKGAAGLISGEPLQNGGSPMPLAFALAVGAFLLFWVTFWTIGGIAAWSEWLRLAWGEDRVLASGSGLRVTHARGPFRSSKEYTRDVIRGILLTPRHQALAIETARERIELSGLGTNLERMEALTALRSELAIGEDAAMSAPGETSATLPKGWEETITPEGERALVPDSRNRRAQARFVGVLAVAMTGAAVATLGAAVQSPGMIPGAIVTVLATAGLTWATMWLVRGRMEWKIGGGRVTLRRRFGSTLRDEFEADRLEIVMTSDSDGDEWYSLDAVRGETAAAVTPTSIVEAATYRGKDRRRITSTMHDPSVPLRLGAWMSRAAGIPVEDRTTARARQAEITVLKSQLDASGPLGKFALKLIERAESKQAGKTGTGRE